MGLAANGSHTATEGASGLEGNPRSDPRLLILVQDALPFSPVAATQQKASEAENRQKGT